MKLNNTKFSFQQNNKNDKIRKEKKNNEKELEIYFENFYFYFQNNSIKTKNNTKINYKN